MTSLEDTSDLRLADFGLSKIIGPSEQSSEPFGTVSYAAPEVLQGYKYGKEVDLWSLGVVTYLLVSGTLPFDDDEEENIINKCCECAVDYSSPWISKTSRNCRNFIKSLLVVDPAKRLPLAKVLQHPWLICDSDLKRKRSISPIQKSFALNTSVV
jgi:serine/threonine protein kinase